jgi:hypothetical protein
MEAHIMNKVNYPLFPSEFNGKPVVRIDENKSMTADEKDPILIKKDIKGEWEPAEKVELQAHRDELAASFGSWHDQEVTKTTGMLWWKKTEVVRPKDGKIDNDEIETFDLHFRGPNAWRRIGARDWFVGAEIATNQTPTGNLTFISMVTQHINGRRVNGQYEAYKLSEKIIADDKNWLINKK